MVRRNPQEFDVTDIEAQLAAARQAYIDNLPAHLAELGDIVRLSVETGDLEPLAAFLAGQDIMVPSWHLEQFRDLIIVRRLDLKDLEPEARARLRARTIEDEDSQMMTDDYRDATSQGEKPHCVDCLYFVTPPNDERPGGDKACVSMGTKGVDVACFGFTKK